MPLPKRRHSRARQGKRRANWRLRAPHLSPCPDCRALRLSHRACPACGNYGGESVVEIRRRIHRGSD